MSDQISKFLQERIHAGDFPSAVYLVAEKGDIVLHEALGYAVVEPELIEAKRDTIYDLASITKVLITGLLSAQFIERGEVSLDDQVCGLLSEFQSEDKRKINLIELLSHSSRLEALKPLYLCVSDPSDIIADIDRTPLTTVNNAVIYSDLNFILLGKIIERIIGRDLNEAADEGIFQPLGVKDTSFNPSKELRQRIAASEKGNEFEKQTSVEKGYLTLDDRNPVVAAAGSDMLTPFRDRQIWGEVHDGNAYFLRGVAGHAGLFSTAEEVFKIALQFLPTYSRLLKPKTCELFTTNFTPNANEHRSFAFQLASTRESTAGSLMSPQSFGHLGFTGTSLWIDPVT